MSPRSAGGERLALICSLPVEIRALRRHLVRGHRLEPDVPGGWLGRLEGREVTVLRTGVGARRAENSVRSLLAHLPVARALAFGFGAGLSDSLRTGDVLLAAEITSAETPDETHTADADLRGEAGSLRPGSFRIESGRLVSVPGLVRRSTEKLALGASTGALVCDMETIGVARALDASGVPALYARCVVDEAAHDLPPGLERLLAPEGRLQPLEVLRLMASRPAVLPGLWKLGRRSRRAAENLAWLVRTLARRLPSDNPGTRSS